MHLVSFCELGKYGSPFTSNDRARTIAALYLAQGDGPVLSGSEMRRDVLTGLASTRAVSYWLNQVGRLDRTRKIGAVQILRLTDAGLRECMDNLSGGGNFPVSREQVDAWRRRMLDRKSQSRRLEFRSIPQTGECQTV